MHWRKITIVGVGLLGGSLGLALRQRRLASRVTGFVRREASVSECRELGVVDEATLDLGEAVRDAELVILCTPIARMGLLTRRMAPALKAGTVVTDVGSVKETVVREMEPLLAAANAHFVGSHPMAGAEKMGAAAAREDLFHGAVCVVTPTGQSNSPAVEQVEHLWRGVGARTMRLTPGQHDKLVSRSSHLPHVVAAELVRVVLGPECAKEQAELCATGFRDTTRIASGSPEMWRDVAEANRGNLALAIDDFIAGLQSFRRALENNDARAIEEFFVQARQRREDWCGQNVSPE